MDIKSFKKKLFLLATFVIVLVSFLIVGVHSASADSVLKTVEDIKWEMDYGASVRYSDDGHIGLKFSMSVPTDEYNSLMENVGQDKTYESVSFGILIMPYSYIEKFGDISYENVFGIDSVYTWADDDGIYDENKVRIINIESRSLIENANKESYSSMFGSITDLKEKNLNLNFIGRGYVKYRLNDGSEYSYIFAKYNDFYVANNIRTIVEVAEKCIDSGEYDSEAVKNLRELYIDKTDERSLTFFNGQYLISSITVERGMNFIAELQLDDFDDYTFFKWVDENGNEVVINDNTVIDKSLKLFAVYKKNGEDYHNEYLGKNGLIKTSLDSFLSLNIDELNVEEAEQLYREIVGYLGILTDNEYASIMTDDVIVAFEKQYKKLQEILINLNADSRFFVGKITDFLNSYNIPTVQSLGGAGVSSAVYSTDLFSEGQMAYDFSANGTVWKFSLPKLNYKNYEKVYYNYSNVSGYLSIGFGDNPDEFLFGHTSASIFGRIEITNTKNGSIIVSIIDLSDGIHVLTNEISDNDVITGKKSVVFSVAQHTNYRGFILSNGIAWSNKNNLNSDIEYCQNSTDFYKDVSNISAKTIDNVSVSSNVYSANQFSNGGIVIDFSTAGVFFVIELPKVNYYVSNKIIYNYIAANNSANLSIGLEDEGADTQYKIFGLSGGGAIRGTIEIVNNKNGTITVTIIDNSSGINQRTKTISDVNILRGNESVKLFIAQHSQYQQLAISNGIDILDYNESDLIAVHNFSVNTMGSSALNGANCWIGQNESEGTVIYRDTDGFVEGSIYYETGDVPSAWNIALPKTDFSLYQKVICNWKSTNNYTGFGIDSSNYFTQSSDALAGTMEFINNGDGTIKLVITANNIGTISATITDNDVICGNKSLVLYFENGARYRQIVISKFLAVKSVTAIKQPTSSKIIDYNNSDNLPEAVSGTNYSFTSYVSDDIVGIDFDFSANGAIWTVSLPKIDYSKYDKVVFPYSSRYGSLSIGFGNDTNYFIFGQTGNGSIQGFIVVKHLGENNLSVEIIDYSNGYNTRVSTCTSAAVYSGIEAVSFSVAQHTNYRHFILGEPIGDLYSGNVAECDIRTELTINTQGVYKSDATTVLAKDLLANEQDSSLLQEIYDYSVQYFAARVEVGDASDISGVTEIENGSQKSLVYFLSNAYNGYKVYLPAINYSIHQNVYFTYKTVNSYIKVGLGPNPSGFGDSGEILIGKIFVSYAEGVLNVKLTLDRAPDFVLTRTITSSNVINGSEGIDIYLTTQAPSRNFAVSSPYYAEETLTLSDIGAVISDANDGSWVNTDLTNIGQQSTSITYAFETAGKTYEVNLPKVNYTKYSEVVFNCLGTLYTTVGLEAGNGYYFAADGNATISATMVSNGLMVVLRIDGVSTTYVKLITDNDVITGVKSLAIYVLDHFQWERYFILNSITFTTLSKEICAYPVILDFAKSSYGISVDMGSSYDDILDCNLTDENISIRLNAKDDTYEEKCYRVDLPWIDYSKSNKVFFTVSTNNGTSMSLDNNDFIILKHYDSGLQAFLYRRTDVSIIYKGNRLTVRIETDVEYKEIVITDIDVIYGRKGLPIYLKGYSNTTYQLADFVGVEYETSGVAEQMQSLNLMDRNAVSAISSYRIAYDANGTYKERFAAAELKNLLKEITGLEFVAIAINDITEIKNDSKYIVVGERLAKGKGLSTFDLTNNSGFNLKQYYTNFYIYGASEEGVLKGVYGFLQLFADLTFYTGEVYTFNSLESLPVASGYVNAVNYDFDTVIAGYSELYADEKYMNRMGMENFEQNIWGATSPDIHCWSAVFGAGSAADGSWTQSDYNAFTLTDTRKQQALDAFKGSIQNFPNYSIYCLGTEDSQYAPNTSTYLALLNYCAEQLDAWMATTENPRSITVCMLAYRGTLNAPSSGTFYSGEYVKVGVIFAPVGARHNMSYSNSYNTVKNTDTLSFDSKTVAQRLAEWRALTDNIYCWFYSTDYSNYMMPFNSLDAMQENYQLALEQTNAEWVFYQGQYEGESKSVQSDWQRLKTYVQSELVKDVNCNVDEKINNFMTEYFGPAASIMLNLYNDEQKVLSSTLWSTAARTQKYKYYGIINSSEVFLSNTTYFSKAQLEAWIGEIVKADAAITAAYNNGEITLEQKNAYAARIQIEGFAFRYVLSYLAYTTSPYYSTMDSLKAECAQYGITEFGQKG